MDAEIVETITDGLVEILKILGPAVIAAWVAYNAGKWQVEAKLKELEKAHAFSASEKLFDYYEAQGEELAKSHKNINKDLGYLLGLTTGAAPDDKATREIQKMYDLYERTLPNLIKLTLRDLKKYGLQNTEEFKILEGFLNKKVGTVATFGDKVFHLLEVYGYLQMCNKMILEEISTNYMKIFAKT